MSPARSVRITPTQHLERQLLQDYPVVAGMDEVGRGSLAGPVCVGVAVVDHTSSDFPTGLADSKALTARKRQLLVPAIRDWALATATGWASPAEIDAWGIVAALRVAGRRALAGLSGPTRPHVIILDGPFDWVSGPTPPTSPTDQPLEWVGQPATGTWQGPGWWEPTPVVTQVKADATCAVVAGASVIAKVERDQWMTQESDPYDFPHNKGYASPAHIAALAELGPGTLHRRSWRLPGIVREPTMSIWPNQAEEGTMNL